jgi:hypothetical protein
MRGALTQLGDDPLHGNGVHVPSQQLAHVLGPEPLHPRGNVQQALHNLPVGALTHLHTHMDTRVRIHIHKRT